MNCVRLVFVGSPLVEKSAKCDTETLLKFGLKSDGCVKATERHDSLLQKLFNDPTSQVAPGGSALNSARVAKWVLAESGEVSFIGCVGDDIYENWLQNTLKSEGVNPMLVTIAGKQTGFCACLLTEQGERSMITQQGAAAEISTVHLNLEHIESKLLEADHIFAVGYLLGHSPEVVIALANKCTEKQLLSLSLSAEYICRKHTKELVCVIRRVNILFGNESEVVAFAEALSGQNSITVTEALTIIRQLERSPMVHNRIVVVTRGGKAVILDDGSGILRYFNIPTSIDVVDSVGCGDAFAGAFVAKFALCDSLDISIESGIRAATEIAQVKGCDLPRKTFI